MVSVNSIEQYLLHHNHVTRAKRQPAWHVMHEIASVDIYTGGRGYTVGSGARTVHAYVRESRYI